MYSRISRESLTIRISGPLVGVGAVFGYKSGISSDSESLGYFSRIKKVTISIGLGHTSTNNNYQTFSFLNNALGAKLVTYLVTY